MFDKTPFEFPDAIRQMAEKNVDQSKAAYAQFMDMTRKAQAMMTQSTGSMTEAATEIQKRTLRFAEQNMEAGFKFAADLARARDLKEYMEIQTRHTQQQMAAYAEQSKELGALMAEAARKATPKP